MDKSLIQLDEMGRECRIKLYNRADSTHTKVVPQVYPEGVKWGEVYQKIQQGNARAKKSEKSA